MKLPGQKLCGLKLSLNPGAVRYNNASLEVQSKMAIKLMTVIASDTWSQQQLVSSDLGGECGVFLLVVVITHVQVKFFKVVHESGLGSGLRWPLLCRLLLRSMEMFLNRPCLFNYTNKVQTSLMAGETAISASIT